MEVVVVIDKNGDVQLEVNGAVGTECEDVTKAVTRALGGPVTEKTLKPEYFDESKDRTKW